MRMPAPLQQRWGRPRLSGERAIKGGPCQGSRHRRITITLPAPERVALKALNPQIEPRVASSPLRGSPASRAIWGGTAQICGYDPAVSGGHLRSPVPRRPPATALPQWAWLSTVDTSRDQRGLIDIAYYSSRIAAMKSLQRMLFVKASVACICGWNLNMGLGVRHCYAAPHCSTGHRDDFEEAHVRRNKN